MTLPVNLPLPDSVYLAAFLLLALGILLESARFYWASVVAVLGSGCLAVMAGQLGWMGQLAAVLLAILTGLVAWSKRIELIAVWAVALLALALHVFPGFNNPLLWQGRVTVDSSLSSLYWNYDKGLAGWLMLVGLNRFQQQPKPWGSAAAWGGLLFLFITLGLAQVIGVIRFAAHYPIWFPSWLFANFFLTAVAEEAFFRGGIQRWLESRTRPFAALMATSVLFGLVHVAGGWEWVGLATLAGLGYGLVYAGSRQLMWAVLAHVLFNTLHLLLFTYPRLV